MANVKCELYHDNFQNFKSYCMVNEIFIEKDNDEATYSYKAQQSDFDNF